MVDSQALRACGRLVRFARTHGDSWLNFVEGDSSVIFRSRRLKGYFSKGRLSRRAEQEWTCKVRDHRGTFKALCHRWDFLPFSLAWSCARIMYARDYKPFANSGDLQAHFRHKWTRKVNFSKADFMALGLVARLLRSLKNCETSEFLRTRFDLECGRTCIFRKR